MRRKFILFSLIILTFLIKDAAGQTVHNIYGIPFSRETEYNESIKGKGIQPLSVTTNVILDSSECDRLNTHLNSIAQGDNFREMEDSARFCIEHCAAFNLFPPIRSDFGVATTGVQCMNRTMNLLPESPPHGRLFGFRGETCEYAQAIRNKDWNDA